MNIMDFSLKNNLCNIPKSLTISKDAPKTPTYNHLNGISFLKSTFFLIGMINPLLIMDKLMMPIIYNFVI